MIDALTDLSERILLLKPCSNEPSHLHLTDRRKRGRAARDRVRGGDRGCGRCRPQGAG